MSRVLEFSDGAERGDTSWWSSSLNIAPSVDTTQVIHGAYCYQFGNSGSTGQVIKNITTGLSELYFRAYVKVIQFSGSYAFAFRDGNTSTDMLLLTYNTSLSRWDITGAATGNTGTNSALPNVWYCFEIYYKIDNTSGRVTVRIDGVDVFDFSGDTFGTYSITNQFAIGNGNSQGAYWDDFALDTADWCGLGYYVGLTPNAAGDVTQWTPTGGANYANVGIPANDATFNTGTTGQTDNYSMTSTTLGSASVLRVIPFVRASDPAGGTLNLGLKTHTTNYTTTISTQTSLTWEAGSGYENNPNTNQPWTQQELDDLQFTVSVP